MTVAFNFEHGYPNYSAKTKADRFGDLFVSGGCAAANLLAVFLRPYAVVRPLGGHGGSTFGCADFLKRQFAKSTGKCSPTPFGDGRRVCKLVSGGHKMANSLISARSEQTHSPLFPLAAKEARRAARLWMLGRPVQTVVAWRDTCREQHCYGLPNPKERGAAFDDEFAREIGNLIVSGGHRA